MLVTDERMDWDSKRAAAPDRDVRVAAVLWLVIALTVLLAVALAGIYGFAGVPAWRGL